jgi:AcrR family transcriptional regulator
MPYTAAHKARTRVRIVESARRLFNRFGFDQVSIDAIMADAGLTRGGFYNHFASKDELYAAAVASYATCNPFAVKKPRRRSLIQVSWHVSWSTCISATRCSTTSTRTVRSMPCRLT